MRPGRVRLPCLCCMKSWSVQVYGLLSWYRTKPLGNTISQLAVTLVLCQRRGMGGRRPPVPGGGLFELLLPTQQYSVPTPPPTQ